MERQMILANSIDELAEALKLLDHYECTIEDIKWSRALDVTTMRYAITYRGPANIHLIYDRIIAGEWPLNFVDYCRLRKFFRIKDVIFNGPATIVFWADGEKTVVKCSENDVYDPEKGLAMAIAKRAFGNKGKYYDIFKKWIPIEAQNQVRNGYEHFLNFVLDKREKEKKGNIINELCNVGESYKVSRDELETIAKLEAMANQSIFKDTEE